MKKELMGRREGRHAVVGTPRMKAAAAAAAAAAKANGSCGCQLRCCWLVKLLSGVNVGSITSMNEHSHSAGLLMYSAVCTAIRAWHYSTHFC